MTPATASVPELIATALYGSYNTSENITNSTECPDHEGWDWLNSSLPVYIMLITVLGIVLNIFVLMVFFFHKKPCTVAEIYLSNLAAADLVLMCCLPFWAINMSNGFDWPFGRSLCKMVNMGIKLNMYCSINLIVLVSIDRYIALVHPMSHGRMRRPKYAKLACFLMWCLGFLLSIPTIIYREVQYFSELNVNGCFLDYPNDVVWLTSDGMLVIFGFIIPISIISFCTIKIIQALNTQAVERFTAEKTEHKATTLILAVLLAFLICWVPFHLVTIVDLLLNVGSIKVCSLSAALDVCNQIFTYLGLFNSALNPLLYVIVGKNFRKKARELFQQWNIKRIGTFESSSTQLFSIKTVN